MNIYLRDCKEAIQNMVQTKFSNEPLNTETNPHVWLEIHSDDDVVRDILMNEIGGIMTKTNLRVPVTRICPNIKILSLACNLAVAIEFASMLSDVGIVSSIHKSVDKIFSEKICETA